MRESNQTAQRLYAKYGLEVVGRRKRYYADNSEDAIIMTVKLLDEKMAEENSPQVLASICGLFNAGRFPQDVVGRFMLKAAASNHPTTRKAALWINSAAPEDGIAAAVTVLARPGGFMVEESVWAMQRISQAGQLPAARKAIPVCADFLLKKVHATKTPVRDSLLWYSIVNELLAFMERHWSREVEKMPHVLPALCRSMVRLPYDQGRHRKYRIRQRVQALLERCSFESSVILRACAGLEETWVEKVSDHDLQQVVQPMTTTNFKAEEARKKCRESIAYPNVLAGKLAEK